MITITVDTSPERVQEAEQALRALMPLVKRKARIVHLRSNNDADRIDLPRDLLDIFIEILRQVASGNSLAVLPLHVEITTQQAATILNVSRPFLVGMLDAGEIPSRKVGTHRRVRLADVIRYQQADEQRRKKVLNELTEEAQRLGLGY